jgi:lysozyme family protein
MNMDWEVAVDFVLKMEGGYTVDPADPGGETNWGISKKSYPNLDIKNLTMDQAKDIYFKDFWQPCACDQLPSGFAVAVFDTAVNQGINMAIRLLQIVVDVNVDGVIGPQTITAAFKTDPQKIKKFLAERLLSYVRLMQTKPNLFVFAINWFHRVLSLEELITNLKIGGIAP